MKVSINQTNKDLFSANFDIIENDEITGNLYLKGHLGTPEVKLTGKLFGKEFYMARNGQLRSDFSGIKIYR